MEVPPLRFIVRCLFISPGALVAFVEASDDPEMFLLRHLQGDWGDVNAKEDEANETALATGRHLFSLYRTSLGRPIRVITDPGRSATSMLLPEEAIN
jgi:hypothetical protein